MYLFEFYSALLCSTHHILRLMTKNMSRRCLQRRSRLSQIGFQKGHQPYNKGRCLTLPESTSDHPLYVRGTDRQYDLAHQGDSQLTHEKDHHSMLLRPTPAETSLLHSAPSPQAELNTYRLLHLQRTADLWNEAFLQHRRFHRKCRGRLNWDMTGEVKKGFAWKERLCCDRCSYVSERHNLYDEVHRSRRGAKIATCNYGAQVGLAHTGMSNTGLAKIALAMNVPAPALSSMQACANTVADVLVSDSQNSMRELRKELLTVNYLRGLPENTPINLETDGRFNNRAGSTVFRHPMQSATQCTQLVVENSTSKKQVIGVANMSKLCQVCSRSQGKPKPHSCSANLALHETIGDERKWTAILVSELLKDGITPHHLTTDGDSKSFAGACDAMKSSSTEQQAPIHQVDTRHVRSNQRRHLKDTKFSAQMYPRKLKKDRDADHSVFAIDLSARCHAEHVAALKACHGDSERAIAALCNVNSAVALCYTGDHSLCKEYSFVCAADSNDNWVLNSAELPRDFVISPTHDDDVKLIKIINYRLGEQILPKMKHLFNTQKTEGVNRAISHTVPRHLTFPRNYSGRVHAAVLAVNHGMGESIFRACAAARAWVVPGSRAARGLLQLQHLNDRRKNYQTTQKCKTARKLKRAALFTLHRMHRNSQRTTYAKGVDIPSIASLQN